MALHFTRILRHLATDNELVRNVLLALLSSLAKVEAQKISERTKAGMARARAKGH
jgi:DNA invertase Pin-like site-specific DNA recombinase